MADFKRICSYKLICHSIGTESTMTDSESTMTDSESTMTDSESTTTDDCFHALCCRSVWIVIQGLSYKPMQLFWL